MFSAILELNISTAFRQTAGRRDGADVVVTRLRVGRALVLFPAGVTEFSLLQSAPQTCAGGSGTLVFSRHRSKNGREVKLTNLFHLVPRLRMSGAIPLLPLYTFMFCTDTALHSLRLYTNCRFKYIDIDANYTAGLLDCRPAGLLDYRTAGLQDCRQWRTGGVFKPPRNSEDIGEVLDRTSKKNRRLDFLL